MTTNTWRACARNDFTFRIPARSWTFMIFAYMILALPMAFANPQAYVKQLNGGIAIVLEPADAGSLLALAPTDSTIVQALVSDNNKRDDLRREINKSGKYGQISVIEFDGKTLPYVDNLLNAVIVAQESTVGTTELQRVVAPGGCAFLPTASGYKQIRKARPADMDEWTQFLHNAGNNGVSNDNLAPPQRLRWHNTPEYGRSKSLMPSVTCMLTANGILYTVEDRSSPEDVNQPVRYHLVARDAFNGIELWKRPIKEWMKGGSTRGIKSISTQLQRRLIAVGDYVYFTMGFDDPITKIHGRTGKTVGQLPGTESTRELVIRNQVVYGAQGAGYGLLTADAEKMARRTGVKAPSKLEVNLYALDLNTERVLWKHSAAPGYVGGSLSANETQVIYLADKSMCAIDGSSGKSQWQRALKIYDMAKVKKKKSKKPKKNVHASPTANDYNKHPTLVLEGPQAFCAYGDQIHAFNAKTGTFKWACSNDESYMKSPELFVVGNLIWNRKLQGIDRRTGKIVKTLKQRMQGPMSHDRCYRNRITRNYYVNSASGGIDFISLDGKSENPAPWVRSTCGLSAMPANGMIYNGPFVCQCSIGSMLTGFNGLYGESRERFTVKHSPRLIKGPAFGHASTTTASPQDWPTYRSTAKRSGIGRGNLNFPLAVNWKKDLGPHPTAPIIVGNHTYIAARDAHTLHAIETASGKTTWTFIAGGRIDSPPTYANGMLYLGSRSGWVYSIRASDGALAWKFNGLPKESLITDRGQLESAWPVNGSILIDNGTAYFSAGRSSYLDGGVSVFGLDATTGKIRYATIENGPYKGDSKIPTLGPRRTRIGGFKSGIFSSSGGALFLRHQGFTKELKPIHVSDVKKPHLIPSPGYLDAVPQHRTYWTVDTDLCYGGPTAITGFGPLGDTIAFGGDDFYEVRGYTPGRNLPGRGINHTPFNTHSVFAGSMTQSSTKKDGEVWVSRKGKTIPEVGTWRKNWSLPTPFAGHAIAAAKNAVVVAGVPLKKGYSPQEIMDSFDGKKGGVMWVLDRATGNKIQELNLPAPPSWDSFAVAENACILSLKDGTVMAFTGK